VETFKPKDILLEFEKITFPRDIDAVPAENDPTPVDGDIEAVRVESDIPKVTPCALEKIIVPEEADCVPADRATPPTPPVLLKEAVITPLLRPNEISFELENVRDCRSWEELEAEIARAALIEMRGAGIKELLVILKTKFVKKAGIPFFEKVDN